MANVNEYIDTDIITFNLRLKKSMWENYSCS